MILAVGLGNIGSRYARTRHNAGFMVIDELARQLGATKWKEESKLKAVVSKATLASGQEIMLAKPTTMMNESGEAVRRVTKQYYVDTANIWLICDDVDTPFGRMRVRFGGSSGGQQGINSTIQLIGAGFWRVRFGISLNDRTIEPSEVYVLKPFPGEDQALLPQALEMAARSLTSLIISPPSDGKTISLI